MQGIILFLIWYCCFALLGLVNFNTESVTLAYLIQQGLLISIDIALTLRLLWIKGGKNKPKPVDITLPAYEEYRQENTKNHINKLSWLPTLHELFNRRPQLFEELKKARELHRMRLEELKKARELHRMRQPEHVRQAGPSFVNILKVFNREIIISAFVFSYAPIRAATKNAHQCHGLIKELTEFHKTGDTNGILSALSQQLRDTPKLWEWFDLLHYSVRILFCILVKMYVTFRTKNITPDPHAELVAIGTYMDKMIANTSDNLAEVEMLRTDLIVGERSKIGTTRKYLRGALDLERQSKYYFTGQFEALKKLQHPVSAAYALQHSEALLAQLNEAFQKCHALEDQLLEEHMKDLKSVTMLKQTLSERLKNLMKVKVDFTIQFINEDTYIRNLKTKVQWEKNKKCTEIKALRKKIAHLEQKGKPVLQFKDELSELERTRIGFEDKLMELTVERRELAGTAKFLVNSWIGKVTKYDHYLESIFQDCVQEHPETGAPTSLKKEVNN